MYKMKELKDALLTLPPPSPKYTFHSPYRQCFSLPKYIIDYIIRNPQSATVWRKLLKSCKYFFSKKQVIPVGYLQYDNNTLNWEARMYTEKFEQIILNELKFKFWLFDELKVFPYLYIRGGLTSIIKSKVYQCDLTHLQICYHNLSYNEFLLFTHSGKIKSLKFCEVPVKYEDGSLVTFDKICENQPNISRIDFSSDSDAIHFEPDTTKKLVDIISRYSKLHQFFLYGISESFDFPTFAEFLKTTPKKYIALEFFRTVPENFKEQIREFWSRPHSSWTPEIRFRCD